MALLCCVHIHVATDKVFYTNELTVASCGLTFETEVDASGPVALIAERFGLKKNKKTSHLTL